MVADTKVSEILMPSVSILWVNTLSKTWNFSFLLGPPPIFTKELVGG